MRLWTIQPAHAYETLRTGRPYRCEKTLCENLKYEKFKEAYAWLAGQMTRRIGPPPNGTELPVWAWHTTDWKNKRPDMRQPLFRYSDKPHVLMELELPEDRVLLSDYIAWHIVLNQGYYGNAENDSEFEQEMNEFDMLPQDTQAIMRIKSWEKIFDTRKIDTDWTKNGQYVQATFWEIRLEDVLKTWKYGFPKPPRKVA